MLKLNVIKRTNPALLKNMTIHYSQPKGFVGRNICYEVEYNNIIYGHIVAGSATLHLPNRPSFPLNNIINNIFYHVEPLNNKYPIRNFTSSVLKVFRNISAKDWYIKYNDKCLMFESLVELPRKGECYLRDGWKCVGETKGFTCKRISGLSTDSWSGRRIWNTQELRPKLVFIKMHEVNNA